jgi:hypothetical protein
VFDVAAPQKIQECAAFFQFGPALEAFPMQTYSNLATLLSRVIVQAALASPDPMLTLRLALLAREMRVTARTVQAEGRA